MKLAWFIFYLSFFSVLVPMGFAFFALRKQHFKLRVLNLLSLLLLTSFLCDLMGYILAKISHDSTAVLNIWYPTQFILLSLLYAFLMKQHQKKIHLVSFCFLFLIWLDTWAFQSFNQFQSYLRIIENIVLIIYALMYLFSLIKLEYTPKIILLKYGPFWITIAVIVYFTATGVVVFAIEDLIFKDPTSLSAVLIWSVHNFFNAMKNFIFALGIYFLGKTEKSAFERLGIPKDWEDLL